MPRSLIMYSQHNPSQSSSCTVPTTNTRYLSFNKPKSFMIFAPYTADTIPPNWSDTPRPPISVSLSNPSYGSKFQLSRLPIPTVSICPSKAINVLPVPIYPRMLPIGSTSTSSNPKSFISFSMRRTCCSSSALSPGNATISLKNFVIAGP